MRCTKGKGDRLQEMSPAGPGVKRNDVMRSVCFSGLL